VLTPAREYGVGQRVTRGIWSKYGEPSYWEVVRVRPSPDLKHGKVFGRFTFRGALWPHQRLCMAVYSLGVCVHTEQARQTPR
jgi:hypothetical protein